ncbi:INSulin related [Caenorhabditis elegans]|uniref:INSulin related n=1 Tax=Caenorhabditis elegans TaxID=6239 RepID=Q7JKM7_CAEEL|nr:INSulin related [Caenorhabditis elegans]CAE53736.1 INSulin related [Caenorhabditis elegans]|eukprot:NP_001021847.1 INSulin related [Caenorhabditis elegans]
MKFFRLILLCALVLTTMAFLAPSTAAKRRCGRRLIPYVYSICGGPCENGDIIIEHCFSGTTPTIAEVQKACCPELSEDPTFSS